MGCVLVWTTLYVNQKNGKAGMTRVVDGEGGDKTEGGRGGGQRKLAMDTAKTCRSKTAPKRRLKHCHHVAVSACSLGPLKTLKQNAPTDAKAPHSTPAHSPHNAVRLAPVAGAEEQT